MPQKITSIRLENAVGCTPRPIEVSALMDSEAHFLCLPPDVVGRLALKFDNQYRVITTPDGSVLRYRYVGPVLIQIGKVQAFAGAVGYGERLVLGTIPVGELGLRMNRSTGELTENMRTYWIRKTFGLEDLTSAS